MKKGFLIFGVVLATLVLVAGLFLMPTGKSVKVTKKAEKIKKAYTKSPAQVQAEEKSKRLEDEYQKAYTAFQSGNRQEAIAIADNILKEDPNNYKAYNIRGIAFCYSNSYKDGMADIDKALEIKPDFPYARFNKALAFELYGQFNDALNWYDKALELGPDPWSYYGKASIYGRRNDVANTVKYLKQAIELDSSIKNFAKEEKDFNPVKNSREFQALVN